MGAPAIQTCAHVRLSSPPSSQNTTSCATSYAHPVQRNHEGRHSGEQRAERHPGEQQHGHRRPAARVVSA